VKTLGIVISTPGRRSLARTLASILYQRDGVEDVLVVGDGFSAPTRELVEFFAALGLPCRYQATVKTRDWGHTQVNYGLHHVRGDYVTYQDDDDIYLPRSIPEMVRIVSEFRDERPLIGRVKTPKFGLLWQRPDVTSVLDGHCLVAPNNKRKLGWMAPVHSGDQCYLHTTLRNYPEWAWTDRIWTLTRPHWTMEVMPRATCGLGWWLWSFTRGLEKWAATLRMEKDPDSDRMFASISARTPDLTRDELAEIAQFAVYACQGNDCWFRFSDPNDTTLVGALVEANFKEHTSTEYTHDWPPDFWPAVGPFDHTVNPVNGEKLDDYRDAVWDGAS
jgi:glycosyltransferase involved in cell wall biosynthesis